VKAQNAPFLADDSADLRLDCPVVVFPVTNELAGDVLDDYALDVEAIARHRMRDEHARRVLLEAANQARWLASEVRDWQREHSWEVSLLSGVNLYEKAGS